MLVLMRMGLVVIALLAACGGQGVDLEVTSDVPFDRVELFLGNDICYDANNGQCDQGVAWTTGMTRPPGPVFVMKGDENAVVAEQRGSTAVLHLEATDMFREPKLMAIVGFKSDTAVAYALLSGERIPANSAQRWQVKLDPADAASEDITTGPRGEDRPRRVHAWKRAHVTDPTALSRCLVTQQWNEGEGQWKSLFVVPDSDTDCDGMEVECDPLYADFNVGAAPAFCVTPFQDIPSAPCMIGTSLCADGKSIDDTCTLAMDKHICVPSLACSECAEQPALASCLASTFGAAGTAEYFQCDFMGTDANTSCGTNKAGAWRQLSLPMLCEAVEVRPVSMPLSASGSPDKAFLGTAEITVHLVTPSTPGTCTVDLQWQDGLGQAGDTGYFVLLVKGSVTGGIVTIPVLLTMSAGTALCSTVPQEAPQCELMGDTLLQDPMFDCQ